MDLINRFYATLTCPLQHGSRLLLLLSVLAMGLSFPFPLWRIQMRAPQYPHGLSMDIYSYKLVGGHDGRDINEINELNHYIGMTHIDRAQLSDLDWIPFAFGILMLLGLRAAAIGNIFSLIDLSVLNLYVSLFSLSRFVYRLYVFGHNLDPHAPVRIKPFMPVILGSKQVANFYTQSYPLWGSALVALFVLGTMGITIWQIWFRLRQERHQ